MELALVPLRKMVLRNRKILFEIFRWSGEDRNTREDMKDHTYRRQSMVSMNKSNLYNCPNNPLVRSLWFTNFNLLGMSGGILIFVTPYGCHLKYPLDASNNVT